MKKNIFSLIQLWMIWVLASLTYFLQFYLRQVISNIAPHLREEFFLSIVNLSDLTVIFFMAYVITLPIAGVLLDRCHIKIIFPIATIVLALSCFIFAASKNETELMIGRILMGSSATFSLLGSFTIIRRYFREELFPLLSSLTLSIGLFGGVFGSWFLITESDAESWRIQIGYTGWFTLGLALVLFFNLINYEFQSSLEQKTVLESLKKFFLDLKVFLVNWKNWLPGFYGGFMLVSIIAFAGFWSIPFLEICYHFTRVQSAQYSSLIFIGYAVGAPIIALLGQKFGLRLMMIISASFSVIIFVVMIYTQLTFLFLLCCLFFLGFFAGAFSLTTIQIELTTPLDIAGSAFSFNAMLAQFVGAVTLWIMSLYIYYAHGVKLVQESLVYSPIVLEKTMDLLIISSVMALITAFLIESAGSNNYETQG